jgi:hypothetical protein
MIGWAGEAGGAFDLGHMLRERLLPLLAPVLTGQGVLGVVLPAGDRLLIAPVRDRDPQVGSGLTLGSTLLGGGGS